MRTYDYYAASNGAPIELFTGDVTGLPIPARAEIVLEASSIPMPAFPRAVRRVHRVHGAGGGATPYVKIEKVRYRSNPTVTCALMQMGPPRMRPVLGALPLRRHRGDLLKLGVPGSRRVVDPRGAGGHHRGLDKQNVCAMHRR